MMDVTAPPNLTIEVQVRENGLVVYIHIDGVTFFRACQVRDLHFELPDEIIDELETMQKTPPSSGALNS